MYLGKVGEGNEMVMSIDAAPSGVDYLLSGGVVALERERARQCTFSSSSSS